MATVTVYPSKLKQALRAYKSLRDDSVDAGRDLWLCTLEDMANYCSENGGAVTLDVGDWVELGQFLRGDY